MIVFERLFNIIFIINLTDILLFCLLFDTGSGRVTFNYARFGIDDT